MDRDEEYQKHIEVMTADGTVLDPPGFEQLNMWTYILQQLYFTRAQLDKLIESKPKLGDMAQITEEYMGFTAFVVTYARCFVSTGARIAKLDATHTFRGEVYLRKVHDRLMRFRHSSFAHTEQSELMRVRLGVKENSERITIHHFVTAMTPRNEFADFKRVVEHVDTQVTLRLNKILLAMEQKLGKKIEID